MNLFFDEVVSFVNENKAITELRTLKEYDVQKFLVSNISSTLPKKYSIAELPSIAPPYQNIWLEWITENNQTLKFGVFLASEKTNEGWNCTFFFFNSRQSKRSPVIFYPLGASCMIPPNGRYSTDSLVQFFLIPSMTKMRNSVTEEMAHSLTENFLSMVFFSIGLIHCKNIVLEEHGGKNPNMNNRRSRSKGTRHHVLKVIPAREIRRTIYEQTGKSSPQSLHFRRGHFKEYTTERPLFGKYTGIYWWEAHVAGKAEIGKVTKDYQVFPQGMGGDA